MINTQSFVKQLMNILALDGYHCFLSDDRGHLLELLPSGTFSTHLDHFFVEISHEGVCCEDCVMRLNEQGFVKRYKFMNGGVLVKYLTIRLLITEDASIPSKVIFLHALKPVMRHLFLYHQNKFLKYFLVHKLANFLQQLVLSQGLVELQGSFEYLEHQRQILDKMTLVSFLTRSFPEMSGSLDEIRSPTTTMSVHQLVEQLVQDLKTLYPQLSVIVIDDESRLETKNTLLSLYRMILLMSLLDVIEETRSMGDALILSVTETKNCCVGMDVRIESKRFCANKLVKELHSCWQVESLEDIKYGGLILATYLLKQLGGNITVRAEKENDVVLTYELSRF